jgi:transcriptional regulator with XRE-family HTH domain
VSSSPPIYVKTRKREPHPVCKQLRDLRGASHLSLDQAAKRYGIAAVVLGSYERGDRNPPLRKLEEILNNYGYTLVAIPKDYDAVRLIGNISRELRGIADALEAQQKQND